MTRWQVVRKPLQRASARRPSEHITTNRIVAWLNERLAQIPSSVPASGGCWWRLGTRRPRPSRGGAVARDPPSACR
jgi:hypothetical protein